MVAQAWNTSAFVDKGWSVSGEDVQGVFKSGWEEDHLLTTCILKRFHEQVVGSEWISISLCSFLFSSLFFEVL